MSLIYRTVTATYLDTNNNPKRGYVEFTPSTYLIVGGKGLSPEDTITTYLDDEGKISARLLCNNNVDVSPVGWKWIIDEKIPEGNSGYLDVPIGSSDLEITYSLIAGTEPPYYGIQGPKQAPNYGASYSVDLGAVSSGVPVVLSHNLNTYDVSVIAHKKTTAVPQGAVSAIVAVTVTTLDSNSVQLVFNDSADANTYRVVVLASGGTDNFNRYDIKLFGAVGNGVVDDTVSIQNAITEAGTVKGVVYVPQGVYKITAELTVPSDVTITGIGEIKQVTAGTKGFNLLGSNITFDGITITGRGLPDPLALVSGEYAIRALGISAASPNRNLKFRNLTISGWGYDAIDVKWCVGLEVSNCSLSDCVHGGVTGKSVIEALVCDNRIDNNMYANGYGITFQHSLLTPDIDPPSDYIIIRGNTISNIGWDGIDTHGGHNILIDGNILLNCRNPIDITAGITTPNTSSKGIRVVNNYMDSLTDIQSNWDVSIQITGYGVAGEELGTAVISNNIIKRYGSLTITSTAGVIISNNVFDTNSFGVALNHDNNNFVISSNTFIDICQGFGGTCAIRNLGINNTGIIIGNSLVRGSKVGSYINDYFLYNYAGAGTDIFIGDNKEDASLHPNNYHSSVGITTSIDKINDRRVAKDLQGSGSPEGVVTAYLGSTYKNILGGAGTSFYVKEAGAGNTGWVGK